MNNITFFLSTLALCWFHCAYGEIICYCAAGYNGHGRRRGGHFLYTAHKKKKYAKKWWSEEETPDFMPATNPPGQDPPIVCYDTDTGEVTIKGRVYIGKKQTTYVDIDAQAKLEVTEDECYCSNRLRDNYMKVERKCMEVWNKPGSHNGKYFCPHCEDKQCKIADYWRRQKRNKAPVPIYKDWLFSKEMTGTLTGPGMPLIRENALSLFPGTSEEEDTCTISTEGLKLFQFYCDEESPREKGGFGVNGKNQWCGLSSWFNCQEDSEFWQNGVHLMDINIRFEECAITSAPTTLSPTLSPTTPQPTINPTTSEPTKTPTSSPTTSSPSLSPSMSPTTSQPTLSPSKNPTTPNPTLSPTTPSPTTSPSMSPSQNPTTPNPTLSPTTPSPTTSPSMSPTQGPTLFPFPLILSGESCIVEDIDGNVGRDIQWTRLPGRDEELQSVNIVGFPVGSVISYTDVNSNSVTTVAISDPNFALEFTGGDEQSIRSAVDSLNITAPEDSDVDFGLNVTLTVDGSEIQNNVGWYIHEVCVQAVADTPSISADVDEGCVDEDTDIPLTIITGNSKDDDNSETLSVLVTIPIVDGKNPGRLCRSPKVPGVNVVKKGRTWTITADGATNQDREDLINEYLTEAKFCPSNGWSGNVTIEVAAVSTEAATGNQLAPDEYGGADGTSKTETVTDSVDICLLPKADPPDINIKGNAECEEDTICEIPIEIDLNDPDGSETYELVIDCDALPPVTIIYGKDGLPIEPDANGDCTLSPEDVEELAILPPGNWSDALQGGIDIPFTVIVTDNEGGNTDVIEVDGVINVDTITGIADEPCTKDVKVLAKEDERYDVGSAIGDLDNCLGDQDGSEKLTLILEGVPKGVVPYSLDSGGNPIYSEVRFIGNGKYEVSENAYSTLSLDPLPEFSGGPAGVYDSIKLYAVAQEIDGNQNQSPDWGFAVCVDPVVDGFGRWNIPQINLTEGETENGKDISLANIKDYTFIDDDGSESVESYCFDFSSLIADAGIQGHLDNLLGITGATIDDLEAGGYILGTFNYDSATGKIEVDPANLDSIALSSELFLDSNQDFTIPVEAKVVDTAVVNGVTKEDRKVEQGTISIDLTGTADIPTTFCSPGVMSGKVNTPIEVSIGGDTTDTDVDIGRSKSEDTLYYVVSGPTDLIYGFEDKNGDTVGFSGGLGTWILFPDDVAGELFIKTGKGTGNRTAELTFTTVIVENDGDRAQNSSQCTIDVVGGGVGPPPVPPKVPELDIDNTEGCEDSSIVLQACAEPNQDETTDVTVSVSFTVPNGTTVIGAVFNPTTGTWVAPASALCDGDIQIIPPPDFSGTLPIDIEAIATNDVGSTSSGVNTIDVIVNPVADGVNIDASGSGGLEDENIDLGISITPIDSDSNEQVNEFVYIKLSDGVTLDGSYEKFSGSVAGCDLVDYCKVPLADLSNLAAKGPEDWHGDLVNVEIAAISEQTPASPDCESEKCTTKSIEIKIEAVADEPIITCPTTAAEGDEDTNIPVSGLSAERKDNVEDNGPEVLSVTISNVPEDTIISPGSNVGGGKWTVPSTGLANLKVLPPEHYAGVMSLTFEAIALETSNGDEATATCNFTLNINPIADTFLILAKDITVPNSGDGSLDLNIRMKDTRGDTPGEIPEEIISLTFTNVPSGICLDPELGGRMVNTAEGVWTFTGTEEQANALRVVTGPNPRTGRRTVSVSGITTDGSDLLSPAITDQFNMNVQSPTNPGQLLTINYTANETAVIGGDGNDILNGGPDADELDGGPGIDRLIGGPGADNLTGGADADIFIWESGDVQPSEVDTITDFNPGEGDQLVLTNLINNYNLQTSNIEDYVQLSEVAGNTIVMIDPNGGGSFTEEVAILQNVVGLDIAQLEAGGNILL